MLCEARPKNTAARRARVTVARTHALRTIKTWKAMGPPCYTPPVGYSPLGSQQARTISSLPRSRRDNIDRPEPPPPDQLEPSTLLIHVVSEPPTRDQNHRRPTRTTHNQPDRTNVAQPEAAHCSSLCTCFELSGQIPLAPFPSNGEAYQRQCGKRPRFPMQKHHILPSYIHFV